MSYRKKQISIALSFVVLFVAVMAFANATTDVKSEIQKRYTKMNTALGNKNVVGAFEYYDPNFTGISVSGQIIGLGSAKQVATQIIQSAKSISITTTISTLSLKDSTANLKTKTHAVLTIIDPGTKKLNKLEIDDVSEDTWVKGTTGWLWKYSKTLTSTTKVNGKRT